jgi:uncharacterized membrane protein
MMLDLRPPYGGDLTVLLALWPTFGAYLLSYAVVGIIWVNHHHLVRYTEVADRLVIWSNLLLLFFVSLVPFFTACMAVNRMSAFSTALYAGSFPASRRGLHALPEIGQPPARRP